MKKILLGTTAVIALGTMTTEAFAADKIKLGLGGFMRHYLGVSNHDEVAATANTSTARGENLQQWSNSEVYFRGSTTLDNGLKVSVDMQMEADRSTAANRRMDISSVSVSSDTLGALTVGGTAHAGDDFLVRVPNASNFDWGDTDTFGGVATAANTNTSAFAVVASDITDMGSKDGKLKYVTPTFSGFTGYASYTTGEGAGFNQTTGAGVTRNGANDASTFGVAYEGELGGVSVSADVTHFRKNASYNVTHGGLNLGMAGFTVGGGYSDFNDDASNTGTANVAANANQNDGKAWELGVGYETGPYSVSAGYMQAKDNGTTAAGKDKDTKWQVSAAYDMGAGVNLSALYFHSKADAEGATAANSVSGVIAGIEVGF